MASGDANTSNGQRRKRQASPKAQPRSKKARMLPTPDMGTPDETGDQPNSPNADGIASALEMLTPFTPNTTASPRPVYPSHEKIYNCTYEGCTKSYNRPIRLTEHMNTHLGIRPHKCEWLGCGKTYMKQPHLSEHVKSHTGSRDFECIYDGCDKRFRTQQKLRHHFKMHQNAERFQCTEYPPCDEYFRKAQTLQRHITSVHLGKRPYACEFIDPVTKSRCTQSFNQGGHLRRHVEKCHNGVKYFCQICPGSGETLSKPTTGDVDPPTVDSFPTNNGSGLCFATYQELLDHEHEVHPPICPFCSKECPHQKELRRHVEIHHTEDRTEKGRVFKCNIDGCTKTFNEKSNMTTHVRAVHLKLKPYICGETDLKDTKDADAKKWDGQSSCGQGFKAKASLIDHVRTAHMGLLTKRKWARLAARAAASPTTNRKSKAGIRTVAELTGAAKEKDIWCLNKECMHLFKRLRDLVQHMRWVHGLEEPEIREMMFEREAVSGGQFWMGGDQDVDDDDGEEEDIWNSSDNDTNADDEMDSLVEEGPVMEELTPEAQHQRRLARRAARDQRRADAKFTRNQLEETSRGDPDVPIGLASYNSTGGFSGGETEEWDMHIDPALRSL